MLATLGLIVATAKTPQLEPTLATAIVQQEVKHKDFDTDIIAPLRQAQEVQAQKDAQAAAEAARQAEEQAQAAAQADLNATASRVQPSGSYGNNYDWGNCTWYVASRISVPDSMGNATNWSYGLAGAGWRGGAARPGAIGVSHMGWAGHVVVVEAVTDAGVLISEMNYEGLDVVDQRLVGSGDFEWYF